MTDMENKLVSVVLCFYNEEKYLAEAIESVLAQTYENFELILVSDGSTDRSCEIADSYDDPRIKRVYLKENSGVAVARNAAYDVAEGDYIAHFDGDDLLLPKKLEIQVKYLNEHPETVVVSGGYLAMDADGAVSKEPVLPRYYDDSDIRAAQLIISVICNSGGSLFRRSLITEHGIKNDPSLRLSQDFHFWHQCFPYGKIENLPEAFFCYRLGHGSHSNEMKGRNQNEYDDIMFRILKFAWQNRGFSLDDDEVRFITVYLCNKRKMIWPGKMPYSRRLYKKIERQALELKLTESKQILNIYRMREREDLFSARIRQKIKYKLRQL